MKKVSKKQREEKNDQIKKALEQLEKREIKSTGECWKHIPSIKQKWKKKWEKSILEQEISKPSFVAEISSKK